MASRRITLVLLLATAGSGAPGWLALPVVAAESAATQQATLDGDTAIVILDAISRQVGGRSVDMRIDDVATRTEPTSGARVQSGSGSVVIDGDQDPIGFRFQVRSDTRRGVTGEPDIQLGGVAIGERNLPNDPALLRQLDAQVSTEVARRWHARLVRLQLDRIDTVEAGRQYLSIHVDGFAGSDAGRSVPLRIQALYDRASRRWMQVHYDLDALAPAMGESMPTATR